MRLTWHLHRLGQVQSKCQSVVLLSEKSQKSWAEETRLCITRTEKNPIESSKYFNPMIAETGDSYVHLEKKNEVDKQYLLQWKIILGVLWVLKEQNQYMIWEIHVKSCFGGRFCRHFWLIYSTESGTFKERQKRRTYPLWQPTPAENLFRTSHLE